MSDFELIGIDGGASKISGWHIHVNPETRTFRLSDIGIMKEYRNYDGFIEDFKPLPLNIQLSEMTGKIALTDQEIKQGEIYFNAFADLITEFFEMLNGKPLLVGIGMPGLKSTDKRGIIALANGPRMPFFLDKTEEKLRERGILLFSPVNALGSDADYCGLGEEYAENGCFKDVKNAYYLGGGTGIADAVKINNRVIPFDHLKEWILKTWEMTSDDNLSLERYISASGIQFQYSRNSGISVPDLNEKGIFPDQILQLAIDKDPFAISTLNTVSSYIARLLYERITTFYSGWQDHFGFISPQMKILNKKHPFTGTLLDRIIIGQRLGDLICNSQDSGFLLDQIVSDLCRLIADNNDPVFKSYYMPDGEFRKNMLVISKLREAPALGAGIDAFITKFN